MRNFSTRLIAAPGLSADKDVMKLLADDTVKIAFCQVGSHRLFEAFLQASSILFYTFSLRHIKPCLQFSGVSMKSPWNSMRPSRLELHNTPIVRLHSLSTSKKPLNLVPREDRGRRQNLNPAVLVPSPRGTKRHLGHPNSTGKNA